jgi:hypothetical protein
MNLESVILSRSRVDTALETLRANRKYRKDKLALGLKRVDLYVEDVEGDWLANWSDADEQSESQP